MKRLNRFLIVPVVVLFQLIVSAPAAPPAGYRLDDDWLIKSPSFAATVDVHPANHQIVLANGLIRRVIHNGDWSGTLEYNNLMTDEPMLRAVRPEAILEIDGDSHVIGGIKDQPNHGYLLPEWTGTFEPAESSWSLVLAKVIPVEERFAWKRVRHAAPNTAWPPKGKGLRLTYTSSASALAGVEVHVRYEIYDGVPALSKWVEVHNESERSINIDSFVAEQLAVVPYEDPVEYRGVQLTPPNSLHVETDYAFQGMSYKNSAKHSVHWLPDPEFGTQVNYLKQNPCLLEVRPTRGPDQTVKPGGVFSTFRVFELVHDSTNRERRGLAQRRFYRVLAPWVTENPLILHVVSTDEKVVRTSIDQAAECGFEMVSLSFGSGLNMEDESSKIHAKFRALSDYAMSKGVHLGGYSLLSSRRIGDGQDVVSPEGEKPTHGNSPALSSEWGLDYFRKLGLFFEESEFLQFTHDGSYPGDWDVTPRPPVQKGLNDSQWVQWKIITDFYQKLRGAGVYLRIPDYYFLAGANETGMGYREVNWSLPRAEQVIHTRQNIYDGTWQKTPSMGWMFVPLTQYHGGGAAATIEPLSEHLDHYEKMMQSNLLLGVQAVYRGFRLYDTDETKAMVQRVVEFYKEHRDILESDLIHLKRANGQGLDYMLHVNPALKEKGFLAVFNPLSTPVETTLKIPLYAAGLEGSALVTDAENRQQIMTLDRFSKLDLPVSLKPDSYTWFIFETGVQ